MKLKVLRFSSQVDSTSGLLFEETHRGDRFLCYTLEDERRALKVKGETRVPAGTYKIDLRTEGGFHSRYDRKYPGVHIGMLHVLDVPNFEYILIHTGNTDEHTAGCLIVNAYKRIYPSIAKAIQQGEEVTIEYIDFD